LKIRNLEEIEQDEKLNPQPVVVPKPINFRPTILQNAAFLAGRTFSALGYGIVWMIDKALILGIILGVIGCIVFGLRYLFS
jgi:hypothetical protein